MVHGLIIEATRPELCSWLLVPGFPPWPRLQQCNPPPGSPPFQRAGLRLFLLLLNIFDGHSSCSPQGFRPFPLRLLLEKFCGLCHFILFKTEIVVGDGVIHFISGKRQPSSQQTRATSPFHVLPSPSFVFSLPLPPLTLINPHLLICFAFLSKELSFFYWYFLMPSLIFLEQFISRKEGKGGGPVPSMPLHL